MAYTYYRSITVDHAKCGSSNSSNFPLLVTGTYTYLKTVANGGHVQNSNGYDIAFFSDSGLTTALNFERVAWNASTGAVEFHVKVPTLNHASDTVIYMAYGDAGISTDQQSATSTWDSDFVGVFHMGDGSTLSANDSTPQGNNGSATSVSTTTGKAGLGAGSFNGSSSVVTTGTTNFSTSTATVELWVKVTGQGSYNNGTYIFNYGNRTYQAGFGIQAAWNSNEWRIIGGQGTNHTATFTDWHHLVMTVGPSRKFSFYLDGTVVDNNVDNNPWGDSWGINLAGGFSFGGIPAFVFSQCLMDEVRVSKIQRGADYITATYNNQNSPSTFYTVGSEVGGNTTTTQTLIGNARITVDTTKTLNGNSRVQKSAVAQTITSNSRVQKSGVTQTLTGNANITAGGSFYWRTVTIDHTQVPNTDQTNFPVLVSISDATFKTVANGGHVQNSNGYDIRFFSDSGFTTPLCWEIESYDGSAGTFLAWVKIPSLSHSSDTTIYVTYGDSSLTTFQSTASSVWDGNYKAVFHCSEDPAGSAPQLHDSTTSANHLTVSPNPIWGIGGGGSVSRVTGKIGKATSFNPASQYYGYSAMSSSNSGIGTANISIEAWVKVNDFITLDGDAWAGVGTNPTLSYPYHQNCISIRSDSKVEAGIGNYPDSSSSSGPSGTLSTGVWYHVVAVKDGSVNKIYVNGSIANSATIGTGNQTDDKIIMGFIDRCADSTFDEVRYSNTKRSADWIATSYNNQNAPGSFSILGSENSGGSGDITTTQTLTGNARITVNTTKTLMGNARVQKSAVAQSITANARIQKPAVAQTLSGNGRITARTTQTISGNASVRKTTTQNLSGNSRITRTGNIQSLSGNSRIQKSGNSQSLTGNATIVTTRTTVQTLVGNASIRKTTTKTLSGNARIQKAGNVQTLSGNARITVRSTQTIQGNAAIITTGTTIQTLSSNASIRNTTTRTLQGNSRIQKAGNVQNFSANSRITAHASQSISANARITVHASQTLSGNAKITATTQRVLSGNARIQKPGNVQTIFSNARITNTTTKTLQGNSRIVLQGQGEQFLEGNARIQVVTRKTLTGAAFIWVPAMTRGVRVHASNRTVHVPFSNRTVHVPSKNTEAHP